MYSKSANLIWQLRTRQINFADGAQLMGIVNVTPDSFSDGGKYIDCHAAVKHAMALVAEGADILDIGGESTRPYSKPVAVEDELARVIPVIESITQSTDVPVSIDTSKAEVAQAAIDAGAEIINDISGFRDDAMVDVARNSRAGICAMHMQGTPQTMQDQPQYNDVVEEIYDFLQMTRTRLEQLGIESDKICLDPGIGFGKTHEHNIALLQQCDRFLELDKPILIGHSRKGFIARLLGDQTECRDPATALIASFLHKKAYMSSESITSI